MEILHKTILQNRLSDYLVVAATILIGLLTIGIFRAIVLKRLQRWAQKTETTWDDAVVAVVAHSVIPLLYVGIFYLGLRGLKIHAALAKALDVGALSLLTVFVVKGLIVLLDHAFRISLVRKTGLSPEQSSLKGLMVVIKILLWVGGALFLFDNLGFKVTSILAGLGIGGVAVALAAQVILGDLFSYFAIFFDRPFEIGDFILVGDLMGTVEQIGIKTTRLRSLNGEELIFSNSDLTNSRVRNFKRMERRRVSFKLGVTYQTDLKKLEEIPQIVKKIVLDVPETLFDRAHFSVFGDFSLIFEVVYFVQSPDYNKYMDIQQQINLAIYKEFDKRGIEFAYPTQTIYTASSHPV